MAIKQFDYKGFWTRDNLRNIIPGGHGKFPEGWNPMTALKLLYAFENKTVLDFGCGYGRLCQTFDPLFYLGVDINPKAVIQAKKMFPLYSFKEIEGFSDLPEADVTLAYAVFNHLDEAALSKVKIKSDILIQCEMLGEKWRDQGPVAHRKDLNTYKRIFKMFKLVKNIRRPYHRYADSATFHLRDTDICFLVWKRK